MYSRDSNRFRTAWIYNDISSQEIVQMFIVVHNSTDVHSSTRLLIVQSKPWLSLSQFISRLICIQLQMFIQYLSGLAESGRSFRLIPSLMSVWCCTWTLWVTGNWVLYVVCNLYTIVLCSLSKEKHQMLVMIVYPLWKMMDLFQVFCLFMRSHLIFIFSRKYSYLYTFPYIFPYFYTSLYMYTCNTSWK